MKRFRKIYSLIFALCLLSFTTYALLDTFVITRVYATVEDPAIVTDTGSTVTEENTDLAEAETEIEASIQTESTVQTLSAKHGGRGHGKKTETAEDDEKTDSKSTEPSEESSVTQSISVIAAESTDAQVSISEYRADDTTVYVADIRISSASQLKTAFSQNSYERNVTADTSDTAEAVGALLAINGDNYGSREKGYVIRNGVLYRDKAAKDQ